MINLAEDPDCDRYIRRELERCRITIVEEPRSSREVPASLTGRLGKFTFVRGWRYWVVAGPTPLNVALELYADPVGKTDIRVSGHCACPPPEWPWITCLDADGWELHSDPDGKQAIDYAYFHSKGFVPSLEEKRIRFVHDAPSLATSIFVTSYHIDTEVGLRVFVDALRSHGLVAE